MSLNKNDKNILYLTLLNPLEKSGLYNATLNRVDQKENIYSILYSESLFIKALRKIFNKKGYYNKNSYKEGNLNINFLYLKRLFLKKQLKDRNFKIIIKELKKVVEKRKIEIIHAHWAFPQGHIARLLSKETGIPYIVTYHGTDIHTLPNKNQIIQKCISNVLMDAEMNIFVSDFLRKEAAKLTDQSINSIVIPNGINGDIFNLKRNIKKENLQITFVGNLIPIKNADKLPYIFESIEKNLNTSCNFNVIGEGPLKEKILKISIEKGQNISFKGHLTQEEVAKYLNETDVLLLPSKKEGWPCVVLEAYACGALVIGTEAGGIPEAIINEKYLVPKDKILTSQIADIIKEVNFDNVDYNKLEQYALNFTWNNIKRQINAVYIKVG